MNTFFLKCLRCLLVISLCWIQSMPVTYAYALLPSDDNSNTEGPSVPAESVDLTSNRSVKPASNLDFLHPRPISVINPQMSLEAQKRDKLNMVQKLITTSEQRLENIRQEIQALPYALELKIAELHSLQVQLNERVQEAKQHLDNPAITLKLKDAGEVILERAGILLDPSFTANATEKYHLTNVLTKKSLDREFSRLEDNLMLARRYQDAVNQAQTIEQLGMLRTPKYVQFIRIPETAEDPLAQIQQCLARLEAWTAQVKKEIPPDPAKILEFETRKAALLEQVAQALAGADELLAHTAAQIDQETSRLYAETDSLHQQVEELQGSLRGKMAQLETYQGHSSVSPDLKKEIADFLLQSSVYLDSENPEGLAHQMSSFETYLKHPLSWHERNLQSYQDFREALRECRRRIESVTFQQGFPPDANVLPVDPEVPPYHGPELVPPHPQTMIDALRLRAMTLIQNAELEIAQHAVNHKPVAPSRQSLGNEDEPMVIELEAVDDDNDPLTYIILNQPVHGTLTGSGAFYTYTPKANFFGSDSFTFQAHDGTAGSEIATISLIINPVNDPPRMSDQNIQVDEDRFVRDLLIATDPENDNLTYRLLSEPQHGRAMIYSLGDSLGSFFYLPQSDFHGTDTFSFVVNDGTQDSTPVTLTVTVRPVNNAPIIPRINDIVAGPGEKVSFTLNCSDPDGDPLTLGATNLPAGASFDPQTRLFQWIPTAMQKGYHQIQFTASDGLTTKTRTVGIGVVSRNVPPTIVRLEHNMMDVDPDTEGIQIYEGTQIQFNAVLEDSNGDAVSWRWSYEYNGMTQPTYNAGSGTGLTSATSFDTRGKLGSYQWSLVAQDGTSQTHKSLNFTVIPKPPKPPPPITLYASRRPPHASHGILLSSDHRGIANRITLSQDAILTKIHAYLGFLKDMISGPVTLTYVIYSDHGGPLPGAELYHAQYSFQKPVYVFPDITIEPNSEWIGPENLDWHLPAGDYWVAAEVRAGDTYNGFMAYLTDRHISSAFLTDGTYHTYPELDLEFGFFLEGIEKKNAD